MNRFITDKETVIDTRTGLMWTTNATLFEFPMTWQEALASIQEQNARDLYGHNNWRLPNRKELFSLVDAKESFPPLQFGHPFVNVQPYAYWSSTTSNYDFPYLAWYVGMGYGNVWSAVKEDNSC